MTTKTDCILWHGPAVAGLLLAFVLAVCVMGVLSIWLAASEPDEKGENEK